MPKIFHAGLRCRETRTQYTLSHSLIKCSLCSTSVFSRVHMITLPTCPRWLKDLSAQNTYPTTQTLPRRAHRGRAGSSDYGGNWRTTQNRLSGANFLEDLQTYRGRLCAKGRRTGYRSAQDLEPRSNLAVHGGTDSRCTRARNGETAGASAEDSPRTESSGGLSSRPLTFQSRRCWRNWQRSPRFFAVTDR